MARNVDIHLSNSRDSVASPRAPMPSEVSVTPSCIAAMKRPGIAGDPQDVAGAAVPLVLELDDPRPAGRDEAVLRGHEERVEQDQDRDPDQLEEKCHALTSRAQVLGGFSSNSPAAV